MCRWCANGDGGVEINVDEFNHRHSLQSQSESRNRVVVSVRQCIVRLSDSGDYSLFFFCLDSMRLRAIRKYDPSIRERMINQISNISN